MPPPQERQAKREGSSRRFAEVLRRSIREGVAATVGPETALAVEFYVDSSLAVKDIAAYTAALERLFAAGSKVIEERCARSLYLNLGLEFNAVSGFGLDDYVEAARKAAEKGGGGRGWLG